MKYLISLLLCLGIEQKSFATEWVSYYVYVQTEYLQGPWSRTEILDKTNYVYLTAKECEGLFGSESDQLINAIFNHLQKETPARYKFKYSMSAIADTITIITKDTIPDFDAVKNELVSSLTLNSFHTVRFIQKGRSNDYQLKDVTVPYMDLVFHPAINNTVATAQNTDTSVTSTIALPVQQDKTTKNNLTAWLVTSVIVNMALAGLLLARKNKLPGKT